MATGGREGRLTPRQIVRLAKAIAYRNMKAIAEGYLDIGKEEIVSLVDANRDDTDAFNRDIIKSWSDRNPRDQIKKLRALLLEAAEECGYVDPNKIQEILQDSGEQTEDGSNHAPVTEKELNDLADVLRPRTEKRSNIDMLPWVKNHTVKMDDLYTELAVDELENKPTGLQTAVPVKDYRELFPGGTIGSGRRVLGKGEPGSGKTTFAKKVAWDWATENFTTFSVVFFVSLKLVEPGDLIENIIIQQTPELEDLDITEQKLRDILKTFGSRCLVILDGYDEHISGRSKPNADILNLFKGQKFLSCKVLLTSRPHSITDIEQNFDTVISIQGFTERHAREFASRVLVDKTTIDPIMDIQCLNAGEYIKEGRTAFTCPILLLFICVLANNDEIDLARKEVTLGEIYMRLVRCLYRKYTVRKGIAFKQSEFVEVLRKVGDVAATYLFRRGFAIRSRILEEVGEDAFEYGLLIGHEDFRVSATLRICDILISFPHRTIQEFLAALYFILEYDDGKDRESLIKDSPAKKSPLCLHFCLWFSGKHCTEEYFLIKSKDEIYQGLEKMFMKMKSQSRFGLHTLLQGSINIHSVQTDELIQEFFRKLLSKCKRFKTLKLYEGDPICLLMNLFRPLLPHLYSIELGWAPQKVLSCSGELLIAIDHDALGRVDELLACCEGLNRPLSLYFSLREAVDLSKYLTANISSLHITAMNPSARHCLSGLQDIPYSPHLTRLTLTNHELDNSFILALSKAVEVGNLPNIRQLSFENCDMNGKLHLLFRKPWLLLTHLHLYKSGLTDIDIGFLLRTSELLPNLTSLELFLGHEHDFGDLLMAAVSIRHSLGSGKVRLRFPRHIALFDMFESALVNMTELWMYSMNKQEYIKLIAAVNRGNLPQLRQLGISMWENVDENKMVDTVIEQVDVDVCNITEQGDTLDWLPPVNAPTLTHLTLYRFICTVFHLAMLMQSTVLTKLHKLDISHSSGLTGTLSMLFLYHSFPALNSLILVDCGLNSKDLSSLARARGKGRLPELRHLDISGNNSIKGKLYCLFPRDVHWENLCSLNAKNVSDHDAEYLNRHRVQPSNQLVISENSVKFLFGPGNRCWKYIQEIYIHSDLDKIVDEIFDALERELLPALNYLERVRQTLKLELILRQLIAHLLPNDVIDKVELHIHKNLFPVFATHYTNLVIEENRKITSGEAIHEHPFGMILLDEIVVDYLSAKGRNESVTLESADSVLKSLSNKIEESLASPIKLAASELDMSSVLSLVSDQHLSESQTKQLIDAVRMYFITLFSHHKNDVQSDERKEIFAKYGVDYLIRFG